MVEYALLVGLIAVVAVVAVAAAGWRHRPPVRQRQQLREHAVLNELLIRWTGTRLPKGIFPLPEWDDSPGWVGSRRPSPLS